MPKRCKIARLLKRYTQICKELRKTESELSQIMKECPERTSCFLRYGPHFSEPYAPGDPIESDVEDWQVILANFYGEQANKLLRKREEILKQKCALASRIYKLRGKVDSLSVRSSHLRKPWFKR